MIASISESEKKLADIEKRLTALQAAGSEKEMAEMYFERGQLKRRISDLQAQLKEVTV